mgnify:CR=1 FL=1
MNRVIEGWDIRIWVGPAEGWMVAIRLFLPTDPAEVSKVTHAIMILFLRPDGKVHPFIEIPYLI